MDDAVAPVPVPVTLDDVCEEGLRLAAAAEQAGLPLRLMGGVAVWERCPSVRLPALARVPADVDFMGLSRAATGIKDFFEAQGYAPDRLFNALHGAKRLNFADESRGRPVDVVLDRFAMCHTIDLRSRLTLEPLTIPPTDLLLTKLQIVEINEKDVRDLVALLADVAPDLPYLTGLLGTDWGFEHTVRKTIARIIAELDRYQLDADVAGRTRARAEALLTALGSGPKTLGWRMRARLGERIRWHEIPEEARH
jgi:hypothetical protein